jgi:hypothetical protein
MPRNFFTIFVFSLTLALVQGHSVSAQDNSVSAHIEAIVRLRQAQAARRIDNLDEAIRLLREAITLGAPATALRELAQCLESQRRWREAAGAWTQYAGLAHTPTERDAAIERREALRRMLTNLRVRVSPPIAARIARVWFDRDAPRWYVAGGIENVAEGGRRRVRVEAQGYEPWEMMVNAAFGEGVQVVVVMTPVRR